MTIGVILDSELTSSLLPTLWSWK